MNRRITIASILLVLALAATQILWAAQPGKTGTVFNRRFIAKVKPGNHWNDPHDAAVHQGFKSPTRRPHQPGLSVISGPAERIRFFMPDSQRVRWLTQPFWLPTDTLIRSGRMEMSWTWDIERPLPYGWNAAPVPVAVERVIVGLPATVI